MASHIVAIVVHKSVNTTIPLLEEIVTTSCPAQNVLLTAASKNVAIHWTTGGMTYTEEMKSFLGFLYLGKSDNRINKEGRRLSTIESKTIWK